MELCVAITTVANRTLKELVILYRDTCTMIQANLYTAAARCVRIIQWCLIYTVSSLTKLRPSVVQIRHQPRLHTPRYVTFVS